MNAKVEIKSALDPFIKMIELLNECAVLFDQNLTAIAVNKKFLEQIMPQVTPGSTGINDIFAFPYFKNLTPAFHLSELQCLCSQEKEDIFFTSSTGGKISFQNIGNDAVGNPIILALFDKPASLTGFEEYIDNFPFLNKIAETTGALFYIQDIIHDQFLCFTDNLQNTLGYSTEEVNRIKFNKIIRKIEKSGTQGKMPTSVNSVIPGSGAVLIQEFLLQKSDGQRVWFEEKAIKIKDPKGKNIGQFGVLTDLSEKKNLTTVLKDTKYNLTSLLNYSPIGMAVLQDGNVVFANNAALQILGAKETPIIQEMPAHKGEETQYRFAFASLFAEMKETGDKLREVKDTIIKPGDERTEIEGKAIAIQYEERFAVQLIFQDVTNQNQQEKIGNTINQILEASDTIANLDSFYAFIHKSIASLIPVNNFFICLIDKVNNMMTFPYFCDEFDSPSPISMERKGLTQLVLRTGKSWLIDSDTDERLRAAGAVELIGEPTKIWLGVPLKIQKITIGAIVIQDYVNPNKYSIEDLRLLEPIAFSISRAIERKSKEKEHTELIRQLQEINASKDKLFSIVSHDLRTPFNSILGFINILLNEYEQLPPSELLAILQALQRVSKGAFEMLTNLLEFSRFQRGHMDFEPDVLLLNEIISGMRTMVNGALESKRISLKIDIPGSVFVCADLKMLQSILQNLISNAIKFSMPDSSIEILVQPMADAVQIKISDHGVGMTKEEISKLFRMDTIHSTYGTDNEIGAGLGLLLVHDFVEQNKGKLSVISQKGSGTTFTFTLPKASQNGTGRIVKQ
jgi:PAS domain S-box-containing protein